MLALYLFKISAVHRISRCQQANCGVNVFYTQVLGIVRTKQQVETSGQILRAVALPFFMGADGMSRDVRLVVERQLLPLVCAHIGWDVFWERLLCNVRRLPNGQ